MANELQKGFKVKTPKGGSKEGFKTQLLTADHATRLLKMPNSKWQLDEKEWEFKNGAINRKSNTGNSKESKQQK